jgi:cytochrome c-type biogenesis protein CcmH/NrfG
MNNPFEVLGLRGWAEPDEIRAAYRALVKQCHPDMIQDPQQKEEAQERMVALNLAYEEALRLATPRSQQAPAEPEFTAAETVLMAERALARGNPESALRQLLRAESRDASWYYVQGKILMQMEQYESAHQSFREAVLRSPENNEYRTGALEAALAMKKEKTLPGKARKLWKNLTRKD